MPVLGDKSHVDRIPLHRMTKKENISNNLQQKKHTHSALLYTRSSMGSQVFCSTFIGVPFLYCQQMLWTNDPRAKMFWANQSTNRLIEQTGGEQMGREAKAIDFWVCTSVHSAWIEQKSECISSSSNPSNKCRPHVWESEIRLQNKRQYS